MYPSFTRNIVTSKHTRQGWSALHAPLAAKHLRAALQTLTRIPKTFAEDVDVANPVCESSELRRRSLLAYACIMHGADTSAEDLLSSTEAGGRGVTFSAARGLALERQGNFSGAAQVYHGAPGLLLDRDACRCSKWAKLRPVLAQVLLRVRLVGEACARFFTCDHSQEIRAKAIAPVHSRPLTSSWQSTALAEASLARDWDTLAIIAKGAASFFLREFYNRASGAISEALST
jgi:hypothetical protein